MDLDIDDVINEFYTYNSIKPDDYISDSKLAKINRKDIDKFIGKDVFKLNIKNWINSFEEKEKIYFLKLLSKYKYVDCREYQYILCDLVDTLDEYLKIKGYNLSQVVFVTVESNVKSGGDNIRAVLQVSNMNKINKNQIIAAISKIENEEIDNAKVIVFIDDIIGTGITTYTNIKKVCERFECVNIKDKELLVACLYARKKAIKHVEKSCKKIGINVSVIYYNKLNQCFENDYIFSSKEMEYAKNVICKYEKRINEDPKVKDKDYYLGFSKSKLLITFTYETPNNTLCSFWKYSNQSAPLFPRQSQERPSIDQLKKKKAISFNNAYEAGKVIKNENA